MNKNALRDRLIKSINKTIDELQCLGADEVADNILQDIPELVNKNDLSADVSGSFEDNAAKYIDLTLNQQIEPNEAAKECGIL